MHSQRGMSYVRRFLAVVVVISITGCAGAYHDYAGCCVPYLYCSPPPLPYIAYESCHCPTPGTALNFHQPNEVDIDIVPTKETRPDAPLPCLECRRR